MDLEPRRLRVLLAVVTAGGVVEAGRALHLTPQAVSLQITALERDMGIVLFDRSRRRLTPTKLARDLAIHAERVESELVAARRTIAAITGSPSGVVRIAAFQSAIRWLVADALPRIRRDAPGVIPEVVELSGGRAEQALRTGSIDLVIDERDSSTGLIELKSIHTELIQLDPYQLVAPSHTGRRIRSVKEALQEKWIAAPHGSACRAALDRVAKSHRIQPQIVHTCLEFPAVHALVRAGEGVAIIPLLAMIDAEGVDTCPVKGLGARQLITAQRTSRRGTEPAVDAVVNALVTRRP
jgi:DNA-binding transcriptional LysR family regulator